MIHRSANPRIILEATNLQDAPLLTPHAINQAKLSGARVLLVHVLETAYLRTKAGWRPAVRGAWTNVIFCESRVGDRYPDR
jgi:hypothetical protein